LRSFGYNCETTFVSLTFGHVSATKSSTSFKSSFGFSIAAKWPP
jgi:hypothetical protein